VNRAYWSAKVEGNRERDRVNIAKLGRQGWKVFTVRECEIEDDSELLLETLRTLRDIVTSEIRDAA
jgi:G:T-mismatch repair DNA endonuclease (very short patch repair protein)